MKKRVLISYTGNQDPLNKQGKEGPILTLIKGKRYEFEEVYLLYTRSKDSRNDHLETAKATKEAINKIHPQIEVHLLPINTDDPSDHILIYKLTQKALSEIKTRLNEKNTRIFINISSGTPQMHIAFFLLVASRYIAATMLYQTPPQFGGQIREIIPWCEDMPSILPSIPRGKPESTNIPLENLCQEIGLKGKSPVFLNALLHVQKYAPYDLPVIILGESGTGKDLFARLIHLTSPRKDKRFLAFNCAAIPENLAESELFGYKKGAFTGASIDRDGLFKQADRGTIFLDEIGDLSLNLQAKLLRVLENGEILPIGAKCVENVDVRVIAATHKNLEDMVSQGKFREDLYYRINILKIDLPPLRDRKEDIPEISKHILQEFCEQNQIKKTFSDRALSALMAYHWPGNIRELKTFVWRAAIEAEGEVIDYKDLQLSYSSENNLLKELPATPYEGFQLNEVLDRLRMYYYKTALKKAGGNKSKAARLLGVSPQAISKIFKKEE
ncbi:MAG: RNA repair transcriptional activator RtcR family protein [Desulfonauticus sp.]|nr:RNA repair transcriptional activator RtcR family protein [Desulfonauticus sp.]